ncbi:hypothetical protein RPMA_24615 [Tardiphaga alba]|uniref:Calcium-binding protein n=1 Tax=Tardiphaga alba TaxID=340268 RepID=A0ABX8AFI9_9BRAD|nr:hypothetical protein [Tardiphaga alba]QUS41681.1 hypothetical protein RPMA_24615 [Tardiphaga alba]
MIAPSAGTPFYSPYLVPTPPSPPDMTMPNPAAEKADRGLPAASDPAKQTTASIGMSPVVQAFLLWVQEQGMSSLAGTDGDDVIKGWSSSLVDAGDGNDRIDVWSNSVVAAGAGDDVVRAWSGSVVDGGAGDDQIDVWSESVVDAGSGNDVVKAWSNSRVSGGDGQDRISAWSDSDVDGGSGDDVISVWSNSRVKGGTGDDVISVGTDSIVRFDAGDGRDTVNASVNTRLELGAGISRDGTHVTISGNKAVITFEGSTDEITVNLRASSPMTLSFADGTTMEVAANRDEMTAIKPTMIAGDVVLRG